ncbi:type I pantothenate kinase [Fodinicola feengrottensis]|uniref:type I pantothenate kinase n=1 Tax=Fodinicola feengrottensis TaxID=435914 RepID=UPI0013D7DD7E|nr:type I pantothenate kinase [Fodinicola feengrottensis]
MGLSVPPAAVTREFTSLYVEHDRDEWRALAEAEPLPLTLTEIERLRGLGDHLDLDEVGTVYLPLSRLLSMYVANTQRLWDAQRRFLGSAEPKVPFVIAVAGSVAVGKSTTARLLQALLSRWPDHPRVELVTTDGFLHPNSTLIARNLLHRKGFPEARTYDRRALVRFLAEVKAGRAEVHAPVYSHLVYDIVPGQVQTVRQPDILILEGLNVLQHGTDGTGRLPKVFLSDFFDFSVYVDALEADVKSWYMHRFLKLRETAFRDPTSYFRRYAELSHDQAMATAESLWEQINGPNLRENIAPTRSRARLVLTKGVDHTVRRIRLRRL